MTFCVGDIVVFNKLFLGAFKLPKKTRDRRGSIVRLRGGASPKADIQWEGRASLDKKISLSFLEKVRTDDGSDGREQRVE